MAKGLIKRVVLSIGVAIAALPGVVIEPGPISETLALSVILGIWSVDWGGEL